MARGKQKEVRIWLAPEEIERLDSLRQIAGEKRLGRFIENQINQGFKSAGSDIVAAKEYAQKLRVEAENYAQESLQIRDNMVTYTTEKQAEIDRLVESNRKEKEKIVSRVYEEISKAIDAKFDTMSRALADGLNAQFNKKSDLFDVQIEHSIKRLISENERFMSHIIAGLSAVSPSENDEETTAVKLAEHLNPERK
jgi:hypothetical protein